MSDVTDTPPVDTPAPPDVADAPKPVEKPETGSKDWQAEAEKWKSFARKHEDSAKANADKARRFDEFEESQKTEQQKLADAAATAQEAAKTASSELALMKAAVKHGLSETDLELLGTHGTPDEIDLRAEKLAARLKVAGEAKPKPDFGGGDRGEDVATGKQLTKADVDKLYAEKKYDEIEKARTDGRLATLLGG